MQKVKTSHTINPWFYDEQTNLVGHYQACYWRNCFENQ